MFFDHFLTMDLMDFSKIQKFFCAVLYLNTWRLLTQLTSDQYLRRKPVLDVNTLVGADILKPYRPCEP